MSAQTALSYKLREKAINVQIISPMLATLLSEAADDVDRLDEALGKLESIREISNGWVDSEDIDAILRGDAS